MNILTSKFLIKIIFLLLSKRYTILMYIGGFIFMNLFLVMVIHFFTKLKKRLFLIIWLCWMVLNSNILRFDFF